MLLCCRTPAALPGFSAMLKDITSQPEANIDTPPDLRRKATMEPTTSTPYTGRRPPRYTYIIEVFSNVS
jgi:hypothetical protein